MIKSRKALALLLAGVMVMGTVSGCGNNGGAGDAGANQPAQTTGDQTTPDTTAEPKEPDNRLAKDVYANYDPSGWYNESEVLYDAILGDFVALYDKAEEADSLAERYAYQAAAEAKMLGQGVMIPLTTRGGNYAIRRIAPRSVNSTLWGANEYRYETIIVLNEMLKKEDNQALRDLWNEVSGTGTYDEKAKAYLTEKGYTFKDSYNYGNYTADPETWDVLASSRSVVTEPLAVTVDGLFQYDVENVQQPALATGYTVSDDGLTYTFTIRDGVTWVDSQGRKVADLTADDFVAGFQHLLDCPSSPAGLLIGVIKGVNEYLSGDITDFEQVGVKAVDDHTVEYTLESECPYFMSMMSYNIFLPMSRSYYTSQGGKFGTEFDDAADDYLYGKDPEHIAYCGPMVITNYTAANTIVYQANKSYWNPDALNVHTITWLFNDGTDTLKGYNDCVNAVNDGIGLNTEAVEKAKSEGYYDDYVVLSDTDATSYMGFVNLNRKSYANFNDPSAVVSERTVDEADRTVAAMQNLHFRRAFCASFDKASYNAQSVGEDLKLTSLRNSYTPATFVKLPEDATITVDGASATFKAGTYYGEVLQYYLDADGVKAKVWDAASASGDGFDGWYNPDYCKSELALAVEELAAAGIVVDKEHPVLVDYPYFIESTVRANQANAVKKSIEAASDGLISVNLVACSTQDEWLYTSYYTDNGYEMNGELSTTSGWGPDYGDPKTYLATFVLDDDGYMLSNCGLFGH